jgi:hypothetical protein
MTSRSWAVFAIDARENNRSAGEARRAERTAPDFGDERIMKQVELTAGLTLESLLRELNGEKVVLMRDGHAVALLSEFDDDELYWHERERDPAFIASIKEAREQAAQGKTISHDELKKRLGIE